MMLIQSIEQKIDNTNVEDAVIVVEPPRDTALPLMVTLLFPA